MVEPLRHRQTKEAATDMLDLQPPRHIPTPPFATEAQFGHFRCSPKTGHRFTRFEMTRSAHPQKRTSDLRIYEYKPRYEPDLLGGEAQLASP